MRIRLSDPALVPDFIDFLERTGCVAVQAAHDLVDVSVPRIPNPERARHELRVYLATWRAMHPGVAAELAD